MITIDRFEQHKYKGVLQFYSIKQAELANTLNISQASLSNQLNGVIPMRENVESEIAELIKHLRDAAKKPKFTKIIKRGKEMAKMKQPIIPKSSVKIPYKKKSKPEITKLKLPPMKS